MKTVFWSWQSDRSERETRNLIREAIVGALSRIQEESSLEERLEIDHDTRGLPGSPDIVTSILTKIESSSLFIADITPIAVSEKGKHVANPNVLIELGYAKKALGTSRIVTIWNTAFTDCKPEDLPFDLRGRRGPISYHLPQGASREELRKTRDIVTGALCERIGTCLAHIAPAEVAGPSWRPTVHGDPSIWIRPGEIIRVNEAWGSGSKVFAEGGRWYVRVLPRTFDSKALDNLMHGPPVGTYGGFSAGRVTGGLMTYSGSVRSSASSTLDAASLWVRETGEIWCLQTGVVVEYRGRPTFLGDYIPEQWIITLYQCLIELERTGGTSPFLVKLGVTGLDGTHWDVGNPLFGEPPVALEPSFEREFSVQGTNAQFWAPQAVAAWNELRDVFGLPPRDEEHVQNTIRKAAR